MPLSGRSSDTPRVVLLKPGDRLGHFIIEGILGKGGMGAVYRARDERLGRKVALKVVVAEEGVPDAEERLKRFLREARSAAALDHPNAVSIFEVGAEDAVSFIAMELVHGRPLRAYIGEDAPDVSVRLAWLVEVAGALAAAHHARLIHRDVKPENVMIRDDGRVKVLDFGLARRTARLPGDAVTGQIELDNPITDDEHNTLTAAGMVLGTPQYMAPEQIRSEPLDARTDQFSWGVLAYEVLTGAPPWVGSGFRVMARILADPATPLVRTNPDVPEKAAAVVMRALSKAPEDRFPSMDDVIVALSEWGPPVSSQVRTLPRVPMPSASGLLIKVEDASSGKPVRTLASVASPEPTRRSTDPEIVAPSASHAARPSKAPMVDVMNAPPREREPIRAGGVLLLVAVMAVAMVAFVGFRRVWNQGAAPSTSASASVSATAPAVKAVAVTELPDPRSSNPEALAAYRAGLVEIRFGGDPLPLFEKATKLDPSLASAHLMYAVKATEDVFTDAAREHLRKAGELRARLTERDQLLLDAVEPVLLRQPASWADAAKRVAVAVERFPGDAQLWYHRGSFSQASEGLEASARYLERAVELDPKYTAAMGLRAENLAYLGRLAEARATLEGCIALAPSYFICTMELRRILEAQGKCEEEETIARQIVTASPHQDEAQKMLASALAARGRGERAVREALRLKWAALSGDERRVQEPDDTLSLALLTGDFVTAERVARSILLAVEPSRRESDHGRAARRLAQVLLETGRPAEAGQVAEAYLERRDAWQPDPRSEDFALAGDATPMLLAVALHTGKLSRAAFLERRTEWVRGWDEKVIRDFRAFIWAHGFAGTVETAEEAQDALATLPSYEPLPVLFPKTMVEGSVGLTLLLGGRTDDAVKWLARAAQTCRALELPVEHTHVHLWLGTALEAKGNKEGACAAYGIVRQRWGKAKPRSVTAEKAADRMKALRCEMSG